ncbi:MAG: hypothetical protein QX203_01715 [Methylococcaceae bacterium]
MTIPPKLIDSLAKGQVIPFVGAGVSMSVINKADNKPLFPSWSALLMPKRDWVCNPVPNVFAMLEF